jgi:hypothetical protein
MNFRHNRTDVDTLQNCFSRELSPGSRGRKRKWTAAVAGIIKRAGASAEGLKVRMA